MLKKTLTNKNDAFSHYFGLDKADDLNKQERSAKKNIAI